MPSLPVSESLLPSIAAPYKTTSCSVRFMCLSSCNNHNQLASSAMDLPFSITTPEASEFAPCTYTVASYPFTYQSPWDGSICDALAIISTSIRHRRGSCTPLSHPVFTALALGFTNVVATLVSVQSTFHTWKRCSDG